LEGRGRRLAARLAAVGRRAAARSARRLRGAAVLPGRAERLRPAHPVRRAPAVRARGLPPRRCLAVRLVAWVGRPPGCGPPPRGRARARRRARRAREAGRRTRAVRGHAAWTRADLDRQPRSGVDARRAVRARTLLGRARQPLTAPAVSPATIRFWKITTRMINGT